jgi:hypothetical protein
MVSVGLDSCGPPLRKALAPPELFDPGPSYDVTDPEYRTRNRGCFAYPPREASPDVAGRW